MSEKLKCQSFLQPGLVKEREYGKEEIGESSCREYNWKCN